MPGSLIAAVLCPWLGLCVLVAVVLMWPAGDGDGEDE